MPTGVTEWTVPFEEDMVEQEVPGVGDRHLVNPKFSLRLIVLLYG